MQYQTTPAPCVINKTWNRINTEEEDYDEDEMKAVYFFKMPNYDE
jgi:hypothetical protein